MTTPPRTIDNLGVETSIRWAQDQSLRETIPSKEGSAITQLAQIDVSKPSYPSEFELLFGNMSKKLPWAAFLAPEGFLNQRKKLFTFQIIPILGNEEKFEAQINRVKERGKREKEKEGEKQGHEEELPWEAAQEEEEEEKEKKIILTLMESLHLLNRFLVDINSRRTQYQKG